MRKRSKCLLDSSTEKQTRGRKCVVLSLLSIKRGLPFWFSFLIKQSHIKFPLCSFLDILEYFQVDGSATMMPLVEVYLSVFSCITVQFSSQHQFFTEWRLEKSLLPSTLPSKKAMRVNRLVWWKSCSNPTGFAKACASALAVTYVSFCTVD